MIAPKRTVWLLEMNGYFDDDGQSYVYGVFSSPEMATEHAKKLLRQDFQAYLNMQKEYPEDYSVPAEDFDVVIESNSGNVYVSSNQPHEVVETFFTVSPSVVDPE